MAMNRPAFRVRVRSLVAFVAVCAVLLWAGIAAFDPTRRLVRELGPDQPAYIRREAAVGLGYQIPAWNVEWAISALIVALRDPSPRVRECAVAGLAGHGNRSNRAVSEVAALLDDHDWSVRYSAAAGLGDIAERNGPERVVAVSALVSALDDARPDVREASALSLIRLGETARVVDALSELLRGADARDRQRLLSGLRRVISKNDRELIPVLQAAARDEDGHVRNGARALLPLFGPPDPTIPVRDDALPDTQKE
ncbi:MAG: HEAT repeat domain-containing protein [Isosphaeraceae bacterium]|nr:HEAT repeat domain-containing protein [Isosphaeraceae bacterium]